MAQRRGSSQDHVPAKRRRSNPPEDNPPEEVSPRVAELKKRQDELESTYQEQRKALDTWLCLNQEKPPESIHRRKLEDIGQWYACALDALEVQNEIERTKLNLDSVLTDEKRKELRKIDVKKETEKLKLESEKKEKELENDLELKYAKKRIELERDHALKLAKQKGEHKQKLEKIGEKEKADEMGDKYEQKRNKRRERYKQKRAKLKREHKQKLKNTDAEEETEKLEKKFEKKRATLEPKYEQKRAEREVKYAQRQDEWRQKYAEKLAEQKGQHKEKLQNIAAKEETEKLKLKSDEEVKNLDTQYKQKRAKLQLKYKQERAKLKRECDQKLQSIAVDEGMEKLKHKEEKEEEELDLKYQQKREKLELDCERISLEDYQEQKLALKKQEEDERQHKRGRDDKERQLKKCEVPDDENIRLFLNSIREEDVVQDQGRTLRVPAGVWLGGDPNLIHLGGKLLIRTCYENLRQLLFEECKMGEKEEKDNAMNRDRRFIIMGNPGIGKSLFSYYLLYSLMQEKVTVVWQPYQANCRVLITRDDIQFGDRKTGFVTELTSILTWYIVDAVKPANVAANTVLVSSPKKKVVRKFQDSNALALYMPIWSEQEMKLAGELVLATSKDGDQVPPDRIKELFDLYGGIPRYVFECRKKKLEELRQDIVSAAEGAAKVLVDWAIRLLGDLGDPNVTSHKVVQIIPLTEKGPERYYRFKLDFVSSGVQEIVAKHMTKLQEADLLSFLNRSARLDSFATYAGKLFEKHVHNIFPKGGEFIVRKLAKKTVTTPEEMIVLKQSPMILYGDIRELELQSNAYWVPSSRTNVAFDSLKPPDMIFQITVAEQHPVSKQAIVDAAATLRTLQALEAREARKARGGDDHVIRFYYVVPLYRFESYKQQSYLDAKKHVLKRENNHVDGVEQYVLGVRLESVEPLEACSVCGAVKPVVTVKTVEPVEPVETVKPVKPVKHVKPVNRRSL